ncbi:hypothetical protein BS47DRAFT_1338172 [Hydnum rufescens UP504]|uniref:Uncharacterized protein n=1 Tax=Hydnum rufescens UP504 TaxID=1448309 RepID=A0A9P6DXH9_9AGAM|nr:hypothetical protein BS47DRAFT_1338172 [Hydnum rufescens UP504]
MYVSRLQESFSLVLVGLCGHENLLGHPFIVRSSAVFMASIESSSPACMTVPAPKPDLSGAHRSHFLLNGHWAPNGRYSRGLA